MNVDFTGFSPFKFDRASTLSKKKDILDHVIKKIFKPEYQSKDQGLLIVIYGEHHASHMKEVRALLEKIAKDKSKKGKNYENFKIITLEEYGKLFGFDKHTITTFQKIDELSHKALYEIDDNAWAELDLFLGGGHYSSLLREKDKI